MKRHIAYLSYVVRHKWFVLLAGLKVKAPLWRLIIHDWSKFLPSEWMPYARNFYNADGSKRDFQENLDFKLAWNHHQKRNKHHWQYWCLVPDEGELNALPMPPKIAREMVADWMGAGRAITGNWDINEWYSFNHSRIGLHTSTRREVHQILTKWNLSS